ncbi:MAG TPA: helix-turn-helix transcriptional regulator [Gemmatimonadaceae bacterium]|nr:helix-turn-helix transcriptional regulator [Gemmatimonadaceae bacterium]
MRSLADEPLHSGGIAHRLRRNSHGAFRVASAHLIEPLRKLEHRRWVRSEWRRSENDRRARYYALTGSGRRHMAREMTAWRRRLATFERLLS